MKKVYLITIITVLISSCKMSTINKMNNNQSIEKETDDTAFYKPLKSDILFVDSLQNIYIRIWSKMQSRVNSEERYFYYDATLLNDSVLSLSKIINTNTFRKINDTLYSDTNYIYQLSDLPSKFPNIVAKELKKKK